jgi:hypothetical protein
MERRAWRRYELCFPILICVPDLGLAFRRIGRTLNISTGTVHFILNVALDTGTQIEFTITLPPAHTDGAFVHGTGKVLRVARSRYDPFSFEIAVAIDRYEISRNDMVEVMNKNRSTNPQSGPEL